MKHAQVILKWWLGLPLTLEGTPCLLCHHNMDAWGHHMLTCHSGGDVITRHNQLRDCIADFCHKACLSSQIEKESGFLPKDQSRPADILVPNWSLSCPAAFDIKVINPLNLQFIQEAAQTVMQLRWEKRPSTQEIMRHVPLEDGHASLWCLGDGAMKLSMYS